MKVTGVYRRLGCAGDKGLVEKRRLCSELTRSHNIHPGASGGSETKNQTKRTDVSRFAKQIVQWNSRSEKMNKPLLKSCKACGNEISRYSPFCRSCGHPQGSNLIVWLLILFLILVLASYTAFMIYCACHAEVFETHDNSRHSALEYFDSMCVLRVGSANPISQVG
jgi:hypothetical protein